MHKEMIYLVISLLRYISVCDIHWTWDDDFGGYVCSWAEQSFFAVTSLCTHKTEDVWWRSAALSGDSGAEA